ncbi:E3 ubiquitin-protein ligase At1g63170-like [Wolffia australiana]
MAVTSSDQPSERITDRHPLLMAGQADRGTPQHVIDIPSSSIPSSSLSHEGNISNFEGHSTNNHIHDLESSSSSSTSPSTSHAQNTSVGRRGDSYGRRQGSPLNSGLWISIELVINMSQIIAAVIVLSLSRSEHPKAPLFEWVIGYTVGCFAILPHLYWRYIHRNNRPNDEEFTRRLQEASQNNQVSATQVSQDNLRNAGGQYSIITNPRFITFVDQYKMALDCFFAVWFVVGNVWVFGGRSSASDSPNLYRMCIVFLTFSCICYAMPIILCATVCCCLPCIISILGSREELTLHRGASPELLNSLPTYLFHSNSDDDVNAGGGIIAVGTDRERAIAAEDALCCICLAKFVDREELRELTCRHFFHKACIDKWLKINALCPVCKVEVVGPES